MLLMMMMMIMMMMMMMTMVMMLMMMKLMYDNDEGDGGGGGDADGGGGDDHDIDHDHHRRCSQGRLAGSWRTTRHTRSDLSDCTVFELGIGCSVIMPGRLPPGAIRAWCGRSRVMAGCVCVYVCEWACLCTMCGGRQCCGCSHNIPADRSQPCHQLRQTHCRLAREARHVRCRPGGKRVVEGKMRGHQATRAGACTNGSCS